MAASNKKSNTDLAECIPDDLVEQIISFLPVKIASMAALVSRRFVDSWKLSRNLCFDENQQRIPVLFGEDVNRVMTQHSGPKIDKLALTINAIGQEDKIHSWIHQAVGKGVEELEVNIIGGYVPFPIPSYLIDVPSIRVLKLRYCEPLLPLQLNGLQFLKTLHLDKILVTLRLMQSIFDCCLALEDLELVKCRTYYGRVQIFARQLKRFKSLKVVDFQDIHFLYINAPTLESLCYSGDVCPFIINCFLSELKNTELKFESNQTIEEAHRFDHLVMSITNSKKLSICCKILEGLSPKFKGSEYMETSFVFSRLRELSLFLRGSSNAIKKVTFVNPCDIVFFLKRCPVLDKIYIDLGDYTFEDGFYWKFVAKEKFEKSRPSFPFLKNLTIRGFKFRDLEFQLVKMIVEHAPSLEDVTLIKAETRSETVTRDELVDWMRVQRCDFEVLPEEPRNRRGICSRPRPD